MEKAKRKTQKNGLGRKGENLSSLLALGGRILSPFFYTLVLAYPDYEENIILDIGNWDFICIFAVAEELGERAE